MIVQLCEFLAIKEPKISTWHQLKRVLSTAYSKSANMSKLLVLFALCVSIIQCAKLPIPRFTQVQVPVYQGQVTAYQGQGPVFQDQVPVFQTSVPVVQGQVPVHGSHYVMNHVATDRPVGIVHQDTQVNPDGSYHNVWESENGIKVQEEASVKVVAKNTVAHTVVGTVSYTDNDGTPFVLTYTADENGFHPQGDHLPVAPPLPPAIARALEYIAAHPYVEKEADVPTVEVN